MSSTHRRQMEDVEKAYQVQVKAGLQGAARSTGVGLGLAVLGHYFWPRFRGQTLALKGYLVSGFTMFGLVVGAEHALLEHQREKRAIDGPLRRQARLELARQGLVASETEIAKWIAKQ